MKTRFKTETADGGIGFNGNFATAWISVAWISLAVWAGERLRMDYFHPCRVILICLLLVLVGCQRAIEPSGTQVSLRHVTSGQTVEVLRSAQPTQTPEKVRLIGIDAPDLKQQPWGSDAKQHLEELVSGDSIRLEFDVERFDAYGRELAYLWVGNQLVNEQLVASGYALAMPRSPNVKYQQKLQRAQESARLMGRGIWNPDRPMRQTPTEFRRQNR